MPKLPRISGKDLVAAFKKLDFVQVSQRGSHVKMKHFNGQIVRNAVIPMHSELAQGTLSGILKQSGVSVDELLSVI